MQIAHTIVTYQLTLLCISSLKFAVLSGCMPEITSPPYPKMLYSHCLSAFLQLIDVYHKGLLCPWCVNRRFSPTKLLLQAQAIAYPSII